MSGRDLGHIPAQPNSKDIALCCTVPCTDSLETGSDLQIKYNIILSS
jgi:hypothetical protein